MINFKNIEFRWSMWGKFWARKSFKIPVHSWTTEYATEDFVKYSHKGQSVFLKIEISHFSLMNGEVKRLIVHSFQIRYMICGLLSKISILYVIKWIFDFDILFTFTVSIYVAWPYKYQILISIFTVYQNRCHQVPSCWVSSGRLRANYN